MHEIRKQIGEYLKRALSGRSVLYHNDAERDALMQWLRGPGSAPRPTGPPAGVSPAGNASLASCCLCGDALEKKPGFGTGENGVMVVLNAPRLITPEEKKLLRGDALDLMRKMLGAIGLEADRCYITNIIKCEPDITSKPSSMYKNCASFLEEEFRVQMPHTVIVMGQIVPLKKIMDGHGEAKWFNIDHPVTLIKNPDLKKGAWNTLKMVRKHLDGMSRTGDP